MNVRFPAFLVVIILVFVLANAADDCLSKANKAFRINDYQATVSLSASCPQTGEMMRIRGLAFNRLYNADSATTLLSKAYKAGQKDDDLLLSFAEALLWKKEFKTSLSLLKEVSDTSSIRCETLTAMHHELLGNFEEALAIYDLLLSVKKPSYQLMVHKAELLSWMKLFDESIALFTTVITSPDVPSKLRIYAMTRRAEVTAWNKNFDAALKQLNSVLEIDSHYVDAFFIMGEIYEWEGKYPEAKKTYQSVLGFDEGNKIAKLRLGKLLWVK